MSKDARCSQLLIIAILSLSLTQCGRKDSQKDGTQDTGGGIVANSTKEQVNEALDLALKLASEPDMSKNVFVQFWKDWGQGSDNSLISKPTHLFSKAETTAKVGSEVAPNEIFESPSLVALKKVKILRLDTDCLKSADRDHNDASVSSFSTDAEICFSIRNLTRLSPSVLLREILSLVLHEAVHMGGGREAEAKAWQELFSSYFGARFGDLSTDIIASETLQTMGVARILLAQAKDIAAQNPLDPTLFAKMGKFVQSLESLPEVKDPLALELKLKPKRPDLIPKYSDSIFSLIENVRVPFEIHTDYLRVKGMRLPLNFMPPEKVVPTLNEISVKFESINELFLVMAGRTEFSPPTCTQPLDSHLGNPFGGSDMKPMEFPPKCGDQY